ncbi:antibiotic biosynthesis monooxygenase [Pedobacter frigiditerrae]|uniref:Antibiotic biosynthesis monooxygenase n=1 Tax=Pedobacter frigiditerrae TaxID=2530452 RepID=A0A4R0MWG6_9SPHI|nr:antibiotic biosynthesis monooxygenase family protein [Pedobacter frigiditerrae]TCC90572.1 antibiotic biosynthesis monooxygenase [Pedobacter frigiditerrae]
MLVRIVKMHFAPAYVDEFKTLFNNIKLLISNFEGCKDVKLLQHETDETIFFTISKWQGADDLENYRKSNLFIETWAKVKPNFSSKAEAWSLLEQ